MANLPLRPLIVIPALNEAETIGAVIEMSRRTLPGASILVVDDGSVDATAIEARRAGATVAPHALNIGVGAAMRTGFLYALRHEHDAVIQIDADGQHDPTHVPELLEQLTLADVVVGSRFGPLSSYRISFARRLAIRILSKAVSVHCHTTITDATSGFRAAGPRAIRLFARYYPSEYLGDTVESLVLAGKVGLVVAEVPVQMQARQGGQASQNPIAGVVHVMRSGFITLQSFIRKVPPGATALVGIRP